MSTLNMYSTVQPSMSLTATYRALVTYSNDSTGEIRVKIPALLGPDSEIVLSTWGRSAFNGTWVVPAVGDQIIVSPDDSNLTNIFWLQTEPVNIAELNSALSATSYTTIIGNGTSTSYAVTHGLNTRDVVVVARNAFSPYEVIEVQWEATSTTVVTFNFSTPPASNSVSVSIYSTTSGTSVSLALESLTNTSVATATSGDFLKYNGSVWTNDPINLGTDTVGDYIANLVAGTGITLANNSGEGATPTISIGQAVATSSNVTFNTVTTSASASIGGNLSVSGNLTVSGTTTTINTQTLNVADNIITLNSDFTSGAPTENAGIEVLRGTSATVAIRWNETTDTWQFTNDGTTYISLGSITNIMSDTKFGAIMAMEVGA